MDENSRLLASPEVKEGNTEHLEQNALERLLIYCYPNTSSSIVRRDAIAEVGPFNENPEFFASEDWELYLRLAERFPFASIAEPLTRYRVHTQSLTSDRLPHTYGLIRLRQAIESRQASWITNRQSQALQAALRRHRHEYAHVYGRLGLLLQKKGNVIDARQAFWNASQLEPHVLKHRVRYLRMNLTARLRSLNRNRGENTSK